MTCGTGTSCVRKMLVEERIQRIKVSIRVMLVFMVPSGHLQSDMEFLDVHFTQKKTDDRYFLNFI